MEDKKIISLEERMPVFRKRRRKKMNRILIVYISVFFLLALGILYFQSSLSEVKKIEITGAYSIDKATLQEWSGIKIGSNIWNVNRNDVEKALKKNTNLFKTVDVSRKFPTTIAISIQERQKVALLKTEDGFETLLENGEALRGWQVSIENVDGPVLIDWTIGTHLDDLIEQLHKVPESVLKSISEIHPMDPQNISNALRIYMMDGYEVRASIVDFSEKMRLYPSIVSTLKKNQKGYIDLNVGAFFKEYESSKSKGRLDEKIE